MSKVKTDQDALIIREQLNFQMHLQEQNHNRERDMMAMDRQRRANLLKHYIETIDVAIKHIKEVEGLN